MHHGSRPASAPGNAPRPDYATRPCVSAGCQGIIYIPHAQPTRSRFSGAAHRGADSLAHQTAHGTAPCARRENGESGASERAHRRTYDSANSQMGLGAPAGCASRRYGHRWTPSLRHAFFSAVDDTPCI